MHDTFLPPEWYDPPREFSLAPFWFWNDHLEEREIERQLGEFQAHGVHAFVIHPRVGLPQHMGWMSPALLSKMRFAIERAKARDMWVILYDEGMYPSGSSSGQVVAESPIYQCRGMVHINLDEVQPDSEQQGVYIDRNGDCLLAPDQTLVAEVTYQGERYAIIDRPIDAVIRGLHFLNEDSDAPPEDSPLAADLLNPDAVACFIRLVYDRFCQEFGAYFGDTIRGIFTDEPSLLGRPREKGLMPGTTGIMEHVNQFLGYDFTPHLPALWDDHAPQHIQDDYERALENRLETTYYAQLHDWCEAHHVPLTGHPAEPDATRHLRYFHIPGQDIVWRYIEPDQPSALEGRQSTQAKAASSAMLHGRRRRNANEFCGAYGPDLTFEEMQWLANWLLIRGCNMLIPHAFYYSVRGPRLHERPPDVGLHSPWWDDRFTTFALACSQLCWLNTDSKPICQVAILGEHHRLPWRAAKVCFEYQIDFNYLDADDLLDNATVEKGRIQVADQSYDVLIVDSDVAPTLQARVNELAETVAVIYWNDDQSHCLNTLRQHVSPLLWIEPTASGLRLRHVQKAGLDWFALFNETGETVNVHIDVLNPGTMRLIFPFSNEVFSFHGTVQLEGHSLCVIAVDLAEAQKL
ncbi:MAG: hypothetical protein K8L99_28770 [Anaerolineae bacterium]|nr:hypothetical protein [Anaerolineae bacterium]